MWPFSLFRKKEEPKIEDKFYGKSGYDERDIEIVLSKLDLINARLENLNARIERIEESIRKVI